MKLLAERYATQVKEASQSDVMQTMQTVTNFTQLIEDTGSAESLNLQEF